MVVRRLPTAELTPLFYSRCREDDTCRCSTTRSLCVPVSICIRRIITCLSVHVYPLTYIKKSHVQTSQNFNLYMLPVVVARSSSDDIAMRYVLPVLWMTSIVFSRGVSGPESKTTRVFRRVRQVAAPGAKLLSTIAGLLNFGLSNDGHCAIKVKRVM